MAASKKQRVLATVRSESGQSLLLALIFMSALSITIGALVSFTTTSENSFGRDRQSTRAFQTAEAGVSDAIAAITASSYDQNDTVSVGQTVTGSIPATFEGSTGSYSATKYAASSPQCTPAEGASQNPCWVITGTATSPDGKVTRSVQQTIYYNQSIKDDSKVYDYGLYVDNGNGPCVDTHGTPDMIINNMFISGCYAPKGGAVIRPASNNTGSAYVGGLFSPTGNSTIGSTSYYYGIAHMHGCSGGTCGQAGSGVYATQVDSTGTQLQRPQMIGPNIYTYGKSEGQPGDPTVLSWNSASVCTPANAFKLDNNGSPDRSVSGAQFMPAGSGVFSCTVFDSNGNVVGSISRNSSGTVDIEGTLFVDGDLDVSNSGNYTGNGTIYVNGVVTGSSNIQICGPASGPGTLGVDHGCSTKWDPSVGQLAIGVINPLGSPTGFQRNGQGEIDATVIVNKGYTDIGGTVIAGSVIADSADIGGSSGLVATTNYPSGAPTKIIVTSGWTQQPGSWKQLN
jgi:hypothetical protein